ncbi:hypothetical protein cyc_00413 [Cyclospora cayetanensis]|uniref:Uncharacterized protein n=1 Tax=Cyclospora cayetanensis TaxID=88456 RepID=A0A1D3CTS9_9EIME|nr:hypothetical protein cyc_00413 [Cyclospora cayetanensis]
MKHAKRCSSLARDAYWFPFDGHGFSRRDLYKFARKTVSCQHTSLNVSNSVSASPTAFREDFVPSHHLPTPKPPYPIPATMAVRQSTCLFLLRCTYCREILQLLQPKEQRGNLSAPSFSHQRCDPFHGGPCRCESQEGSDVFISKNKGEGVPIGSSVPSTL